MAGRRPTSRTLLTGVLLGLLLLDAVAGSVLAAQRASRQERLDDQLTPARSNTTALLKAYVDQETGVRGFVVTADEEFLEPYATGRREQERLVRDLRQLLRADPNLAERLEVVVRLGEDWTRTAAEPEIAFRRAGDQSRAVALVTSGTGKVRFDRLRAAVAGLQRDLDAEADEVNEQTRRSADLANTVVVLSAVLALLLAAALSAQVQRRVLHPVRVLRSRAQQAARNPRVGSLELEEGDADVRSVARSAEQLRQAAVEHEDAAARAYDALAQEAPSVAAITAELAPTVGALPAGLRWAGRTIPAEGAVAGDVYDVLPLRSEQVAILVADAAGHGPQAGLVALRAKHILTGALRRGLDPAAALTRLSVELNDTGEGFLTVFVATVDVPAGTVRYASAGHPSAVLLHAGTPELLAATGPLLGPVPGTWSTATATLPARGSLAVFTDGVLEARTGTDQSYGVDRLIELLQQAAPVPSTTPLDPDSVVDIVFRDLQERTEGTSRSSDDDRTLVLLHRPPRREVHGDWVPLPSAASSAGVARRLLHEELSHAEAGTASEDLADAAQLCLTELVTNAVLHGGGDGIAVSLSLRDGRVHLAVRDGSTDHPTVLVHSPSASTGRGLALVAQLSSQWGSDPDPSGGKVVWCDVSATSARQGAAAVADPWLAELGDLLSEAERTAVDAPALGSHREVVLLRYPVRRGMLAREHYRSLLRECQLCTLHEQSDDTTFAEVLAAAELLAGIYTGQLGPEHRQGSDLTATHDALLAAFSRGDRATDLSVPVGERADDLLAAMQAALLRVQLATSTGELLTEQTPQSVLEVNEWTMQQCVNQLAGAPPVPWSGPLD